MLRRYNDIAESSPTLLRRRGNKTLKVDVASAPSWLTAPVPRWYALVALVLPFLVNRFLSSPPPAAAKASGAELSSVAASLLSNLQPGLESRIASQIEVEFARRRKPPSASDSAAAAAPGSSDATEVTREACARALEQSVASQQLEQISAKLDEHLRRPQAPPQAVTAALGAGGAEDIGTACANAVERTTGRHLELVTDKLDSHFRSKMDVLSEVEKGVKDEVTSLTRKISGLASNIRSLGWGLHSEREMLDALISSAHIGEAATATPSAGGAFASVPAPTTRQPEAHPHGHPGKGGPIVTYFNVNELPIDDGHLDDNFVLLDAHYDIEIDSLVGLESQLDHRQVAFADGETAKLLGFSHDQRSNARGPRAVCLQKGVPEGDILRDAVRFKPFLYEAPPKAGEPPRPQPTPEAMVAELARWIDEECSAVSVGFRNDGSEAIDVGPIDRSSGKRAYVTMLKPGKEPHWFHAKLGDTFDATSRVGGHLVRSIHVEFGRAIYTVPRPNHGFRYSNAIPVF